MIDNVNDVHEGLRRMRQAILDTAEPLLVSCYGDAEVFHTVSHAIDVAFLALVTVQGKVEKLTSTDRVVG